LPEQVVFELRDLRSVFIFRCLFLDEVEQWEDEVSVQVWEQVWQEVMLFGDIGGILRLGRGAVQQIAGGGGCDSAMLEGGVC